MFTKKNNMLKRVFRFRVVRKKQMAAKAATSMVSLFIPIVAFSARRRVCDRRCWLGENKRQQPAWRRWDTRYAETRRWRRLLATYSRHRRKKLIYKHHVKFRFAVSNFSSLISQWFLISLLFVRLHTWIILILSSRNGSTFCRSLTQ